MARRNRAGVIVGTIDCAGELMRPDCAGSVALEYGIMLPAFLLLLLGIADTARLLWVYSTLSHAAASAARCAAIAAPGCATNAQTATYATTQAYGLALDASAFTVSAASCGEQVAASYNFTFVIPWLGSGSPFGAGNAITVSTTTCYP